MFKSQKQTNWKPTKKNILIAFFLRLNVTLTGFFGELCEGLHSLLPVAALRGYSGNVGPAQGPDDVHHGLSLEGVWRNHPREEVIAAVVTQLGGRWRITDLWDLEGKDGGGWGGGGRTWKEEKR